MMANPPSLMDGIGSLIILVLIFYVARIFFLWYFRIDKIIDLLSSIDKKLGPAPVDAVDEVTRMPRSFAAVRERLGHLIGGHRK